MPKTIRPADPVESLKQHQALDTTAAGRRVHRAVGRLLDAGGGRPPQSARDTAGRDRCAPPPGVPVA